MLVDGRPGLACKTLTKNLGTQITLAPLPVFELIGDLSVNTGKWMRGMSERLQAWVHQLELNRDLTQLEERMEPALADEIYELDRCIECGCCVAACGTARMREDFVGAVGMNKIARFALDPRDARSEDDFYELVGDDSGVFGCMSLLACHDVCPKQLPLATQIAYLRRRMAAHGLGEALSQQAPERILLGLIAGEQAALLTTLPPSMRMRSTPGCLSLRPLASPANSSVMATQSPLAM